MKKLLSLLLVGVFAMGLCLTGCKGDEEPATPDAEKAVEDATDATDDAADKAKDLLKK